MRFGAIERFEENRHSQTLPSWGLEIDRQVGRYGQGLQHWSIGWKHWSFASHRYFETYDEERMNSRIVTLLPTHSSPSGFP